MSLRVASGSCVLSCGRISAATRLSRFRSVAIKPLSRSCRSSLMSASLDGDGGSDAGDAVNVVGEHAADRSAGALDCGAGGPFELADDVGLGCGVCGDLWGV